jgi:hypothetical protein
MMKKTKKKTTSILSRARRFGRVNIAIMAAFLLVFIGPGTWFVGHSEASGACVYSKFQLGSGNSQCVKYIQGMLDRWDEGPNRLTTDGDFGLLTKANVVQFQNEEGVVGGNGVVGSRTWYHLCVDSSSGGSGDYDKADYNGAGCSNIYRPFY